MRIVSLLPVFLSLTFLAKSVPLPETKNELILRDAEIFDEYLLPRDVFERERVEPEDDDEIELIRRAVSKGKTAKPASTASKKNPPTKAPTSTKTATRVQTPPPGKTSPLTQATPPAKTSPPTTQAPPVSTPPSTKVPPPADTPLADQASPSTNGITTTSATSSTRTSTAKDTSTTSSTTDTSTPITSSATDTSTSTTSSATSTSTTSSATAEATSTANSCATENKRRSLVDLLKRAPNKNKFTLATAPQQITIKLGDTEFPLTKFGSPGGTLTYTVDSGPNAGDFAKTNLGRNEIAATTAAGQAIASGTDVNPCNDIKATWLVIKKSPGKKLAETTAFKTAKAAGMDQCEAVVKTAINLTGKKILQTFKDIGFNHNDPSVDNCFFDDQVTQSFLIDFGEATDIKPNAVALKSVLEGQFGGLC